MGIIPKMGKTSIFGSLLPKLEFKAKVPLQKKIHISKLFFIFLYFLPQTLKNVNNTLKKVLLAECLSFVRIFVMLMMF